MRTLLRQRLFCTRADPEGVSGLRQRFEADLRNRLAEGIRQPCSGDRAVAKVSAAGALVADHDGCAARGQVDQLAGDDQRVQRRKDLGSVEPIVFSRAHTVEPWSGCELAVDPEAGGLPPRDTSGYSDLDMPLRLVAEPA